MRRIRSSIGIKTVLLMKLAVYADQTLIHSGTLYVVEEAQETVTVGSKIERSYR
jgi:hypothetical protein